MNNTKNKNPYILQINAGATHGGASGIAVGLFEELCQRGYPSKIATSCPHPSKQNFLQIPRNTYTDAKNLWEQAFFFLCRQTKKYVGKVKGAGRFTNFLYNIGRPSCLLKNLRGIENFENYPGTRNFFENLSPFPDIIHGHNLHGRYFDLSILPELSKKTPVFLTLHDEWMFTGHCACTLDCEKWKSGCDNCTNLSTYDPLWRDTTRYNLKQKETIYINSKLHLITPSQWLMDRAKQSVLAQGIKTSNVIHNGIDLTLFRSGNKIAARKKTKLARDSHILLFVANQAKRNPFKDYETLKKALLFIAENKTTTKPILLICTGESDSITMKNNVTIQFVNYISNRKELVSFYQAADLLVHATNADNFPTTILEALACGTPVIGTSIGGVPEQITENTGLLYKHKDHIDLAKKIMLLLNNKNLRDAMAQNAVKDAHDRFDIQKQVTKQINYYHEVLKLEHCEATK